MWPEPASTTLGFVTAVFVHGVPETWIVWDALKETLAGESLALALPGFAVKWETAYFVVGEAGDMAYGVGTNTYRPRAHVAQEPAWVVYIVAER